MTDAAAAPEAPPATPEAPIVAPDAPTSANGAPQMAPADTPLPAPMPGVPAAVPGLTHATGRNDSLRLGDVIIKLGYADSPTIERVMADGAESGRPVGELLVESGAVNATQLAHALAERNSLDFVDLNVFSVDQGAANVVSSAEAQRCGAIPIALMDNGKLLVATSDPSNLLGLEDIAIQTGTRSIPRSPRPTASTP